MTLEEAVDILNEREHQWSAWQLVEVHPGCFQVNDGDDHWYTKFEALAIAEKYERGDKP